MGTKNNPGEFDCYANAAPDEPLFILLARDPMASALVDLWADMRQEFADNNTDINKIDEARACAKAMRQYAHKLNKPEFIIHVAQVNKITLGRRDE